MVSIFLSDRDGKLNEIDEIVAGCWINMVSPTEKEISTYAKMLDIDPDFLRGALDLEERARLEYDSDNESTLVLVDYPYAEFGRDSKVYETMPLGIIYTKQCVVTVSINQSLALQSFINNNVKTFFTFKKSRFMLQILYKISSLYLEYLKQIDKHSNDVERELHKTMRNKELLYLLDLQKSLVYFSTSLRSNDLVLERLKRLKFMKVYEDDNELIEDILIENRQAIEMAKIYGDVLGNTMDAFASIISNNVNLVMKLLTSVTVIMAIPTMISGFYGMNVAGIPLAEEQYGFYYVVIMTIIVCVLISIFMSRKKLF